VEYGERAAGMSPDAGDLPLHRISSTGRLPAGQAARPVETRMCVPGASFNSSVQEKAIPGRLLLTRAGVCWCRSSPRPDLPVLT
jgi:hypothetical protein